MTYAEMSAWKVLYSAVDSGGAQRREGGKGNFLRNLKNAASDDPETRQAALLPLAYYYK